MHIQIKFGLNTFYNVLLLYENNIIVDLAVSACLPQGWGAYSQDPAGAIDHYETLVLFVIYFVL